MSAAVGNGCGINKDALPLKLLPDGSCVPWFAHQELRVNTLFEVAKANNFITGYADKHLIYEVRRRIRLIYNTYMHACMHTYIYNTGGGGGQLLAQLLVSSCSCIACLSAHLRAVGGTRSSPTAPRGKAWTTSSPRTFKPT